MFYLLYMSNLADYLMGFNVNKKRLKKGKKLKRPKRVRWGQRMGKAATESNRRKDSNIEKLLLTLVARSGPPNSIEIARAKQIEEDYQMAQNIDQKQRIEESKKGKKVDEEEEEKEPLPLPVSITESPISSVARPQRFQAYQQTYESIEEEYNELINSMTEDMGGARSVIRSEAMSDFIAKKEQLNGNRNVLRKELLDDIKNNPSEVWEWRGFIEQSEVETEKLLELDNKASQILYDQATRNLEEKEELSARQVEQAKENQKAMAEQLNINIELREKEEMFRKELEKANEKLGAQKVQLIQEATQREIAVEELDRTQKFLSETIGSTFNRGEEKLRKYLAGEITGNSNEFKVGLGQTGLDTEWDRLIARPMPTDDKKRSLKRQLDKKIETQKEFLPKKIESFISALPPGSVMLQRDSSLEDLSPSASRSPPRIDVVSVETAKDI